MKGASLKKKPGLELKNPSLQAGENTPAMEESPKAPPCSEAGKVAALKASVGKETDKFDGSRIGMAKLH